ncbi:MAG: hypothetical protein K0Q55_2785, partial [Verrucomicrobia bacterium]|nr:hypothetical protein [Verrucomicrobiota bacterium]
MASNSSHSAPSSSFPVLSGATGWRLWLVTSVGAYYLAFALRPTLFSFFAFSHEFGWFFDSYAILASNDALVAGLDPWKANPLDPIGRPHVYSHWWFSLSEWGFTRKSNFLLGGGFVAAYFIAAFCWLRVRSKSEFAWSFAMLASPGVVLAVERGNNDLFICALLIPVAVMLTSNRAWVRWMAMVPLLLATGLKFYPALGMLIVLAAPSRKEAWARGVVAAILLGAVMFNLREDFGLLKNLIPAPRGLMTFGSSKIFMYFGVSPNLSSLISFGLGLVILGLCRPWRWLAGWSVPAQDRTAWLGMMLGAILLVGCFFAGTSYSYRLIFTVMLMPMLWRLASGVHTPKPVCRLAAVTRILLLVVIWLDAILAFIATRTIQFESN